MEIIITSVLLLILFLLIIKLSNYYGWFYDFSHYFKKYDDILYYDDHVKKFFTYDLLDEFNIFKNICKQNQEKELLIHQYSNINSIAYSIFFCCYGNNEPFAIVSKYTKSDVVIKFIDEKTITPLSHTNYALNQKRIERFVNETENDKKILEKSKMLSKFIKNKKDNANNDVYYM